MRASASSTISRPARATNLAFAPAAGDQLQVIARATSAICPTVVRAARGCRRHLPPGGHALGAALGRRIRSAPTRTTSPARCTCWRPRGAPASRGSCTRRRRRSTATDRSCPSARTSRRRRSRPTRSPRRPASSTPRCGHRLYGVETVGLRYFNVFGPRQDPKSRVRGGDPALHPVGAARAAARGARRRPRSRATSPTSTTSSRPTCSAGRRAATRRARCSTSAAASRVSLLRDHRPARGAPRAADSSGATRRRAPATCRTRSPTSSKAKRLMGYTPLVDFDEGFRRTRRVLQDVAQALGGSPDAAPRNARCSSRSSLLPLASSAPRAQAAQNLVVQAATEPPGLDLTATPASATAGVVFYNVQECAGEGGSPRQDRAVAGRALAHRGQQELHVLPQAGRALPQRPRAQGRRREVRHRPRDEPGDEAPVPAATTRPSATSSSRTTTRSRSR